MNLFRRASTVVRRRDSRAGVFAFTTLLLLCTGLGGIAGGIAAKKVTTVAATRLYAEAEGIATDLGRGLDDRRKALRLVARMPSVVGQSPLQGKAYDNLVNEYPEFESVSVGTPTSLPRGGVRLDVGLPERNDKAYGTLVHEWPEKALSKGHYFGVHPSLSSTTMLVSASGVQTAATVRPPSWERLTRHTWKAAIMTWGAGPTLVAKFTVPGDEPGPQLLVLAEMPMSVLDSQSASLRWSGLGIGLAIGLLTGSAAWLGVARSTRRLRIVNAALEKRVARRTEKLAAAERSYRGIFENVPLGLYECDAQGRFVRVNPHLARTLGYESPEAMISAVGSLQAIGDFGLRVAFLDRLRAGGEVRATTSAVRVDGTRLWFAETARTVERDGDLVIEGAMHDSTAQHELEDRLRTIGATDPLTGLLNRRGLEDVIGRAEMPVSFVVIDVDSFKAFNDAYGHPAGDAALQCVAQTLRESVRTEDAVARAGGEEFVVVLSRTNAEGARRVAETLREAVAARDILETKLTISGGVATASAGEEVDEALVAADRALYLAKQAGRNRVVVNPAKLV